MKTIHEVSQMSGVSVRTLRYYHQIGLLEPSGTTEGGYRLYDEAALERLQLILIYRELQFPLKEIKSILDSPNYERTRALRQQADLLEKKKAHLENLITYARGFQLLGVKKMSFSEFDVRKMDEYAAQGRENWEKTDAWKEYEEKRKSKTREDEMREGADMMQIFAGFGAMMDEGPASPAAQAQVEKLRAFITEHYYNCTVPLLRGLGRMYGGGGEMSENIDQAGGPGTAAFASEAVRIYCEGK